MSTFINKHIVITKRYNVVTSTPMKLTKPSDQSTFLEWPSPLDQRSNESRSPYSPTKKPHETAEPLEQKKSSEKPETADKICPVDHAPESCEERDDFVANTADSGVRSPKFKQLIIMDSDEEEEFWKNRNSDSNKKRKYRKRKINQSTTQPDVRTKKAKELDLVRSAPNLEEEDSESTSNDSKITHNNIGNKPIEEKLMRVVTLPESLNEKEPSKNLLEGSKELDRNHPKVATSLQSLNKEQKETEPPRSSLKRSKTLEENASPEDSDAPNKPVRRLKNLKQIDHNKVEYVVRRSNRKRCKPLEFWNGERQEVERDFTSGIQKHTKPRKNVSESQVQDTEKVVGIEQGEVATDVQTLTNKNVGRKQSILKKQKKSGPKASVKFSPAIETEKPATEKTEKIDWVRNFDQLNSGNKRKIKWPGLSTAGGKVSSSVIQIRPGFMKQGCALYLQDVIFCLMSGAVTVTVRETSAKIKKYGHFAVPGGVSYCIENTGRNSAVLSCVKVVE